MKLLKNLCISALLAGSAIQVQASVLDFEDITGLARNGFNILGINNTYQGYQWSASAGQGNGQWGIASNSNTTDGQQAHAGSGYAWTFDGAQHMYIDFGAATDFVGGWFASNFRGFDATTIQAFGYDQSNNLISQSGVLNLALDQWQYLSANLMGVYKVEFRSNAEAKWYAVDDLEVNPGNQVPEPATLGIMGLGLFALSAVRRRNR